MTVRKLDCHSPFSTDFNRRISGSYTTLSKRVMRLPSCPILIQSLVKLLETLTLLLSGKKGRLREIRYERLLIQSSMRSMLTVPIFRLSMYSSRTRENSHSFRHKLPSSRVKPKQWSRNLRKSGRALQSCNQNLPSRSPRSKVRLKLIKKEF